MEVLYVKQFQEEGQGDCERPPSVRSLCSHINAVCFSWNRDLRGILTGSLIIRRETGVVSRKHNRDFQLGFLSENSPQQKENDSNSISGKASFISSAAK